MRSTSCALGAASRWPPGRTPRSWCSPSATPAIPCPRKRAPGYSRRAPCSAEPARSTISGSASTSAGWSRSRTTERSRCATRPAGRRRSWPGFPSRRAAGSSISLPRSAALGTPEERNHLRQIAVLAGLVRGETFADVVVQRQVSFAAAERCDGVGQLAPDFLGQGLQVAEDLDSLRRDSVLRLPALSVHAPGPSRIKIRMTEARRIPLGGQGREQADAGAGKKGAADPAKGSSAPAAVSVGGDALRAAHRIPAVQALVAGAV